ncbi:MAG: hypothetical protein SFV21_11010 [Rhodospirillaceae bacterium]|nr:hypothetical protein [Rhodospirillaceae bacterium]
MRRFFVILILLVLIGGGGVGGLIILGIIPNPFNPVQQGPNAAAEAARKAEAERLRFKAPTAALTFVNLRDMIVPVVVNGKVKTRVYISVRLLVAPANKDAVEAGIARYQDAVLAEFVPYFSDYFARNDLLNLEDIKARLVKNAKRIFDTRVEDVLLVNVFEQKFGALD